MKTISLAPLLLLSLALPAVAEAYKCRQPDGRTEISSEPCASGSSTVRSVPDEKVPEQNRERAEKEAERMRNLSDKNEATRLSTEKAEREERERAAARQRQSYAPPPGQVDDCLRTIDRMALDSSRRAELIAGCQSTGAVQPVYAPAPYYGAPYYGAPGYIRPVPRPHPEPMPSPPPSKPGRPVDLYKVPSDSRSR